MKELLVIDVGNSNVKYALFRDGKLTDTWRHPTAQVKESASAILGKTTCPVAISSVVPQAELELKALLAKREVISVNAVTQKLLTGMDETMGADRVADAVAAWHLYGKGRTPVAVIGMGTATTMLVISGSGHVKGGWIAPGLGVTLETLHHRTALLPLLKMEGQTLELGYDTDTHMRNGVFAGHIGLVREWLAIANRNLTGQTLFVGTGGASKSVQEHGSLNNKLFDICDPYLTLKGIYLLATSAKNAPKQGSHRQTAIAKKRWARLMRELDIPQARWQPIWEKLESLYSERGRYYHNLKHIAKTLALLDRFSGGSASVLLRLAAFYHDAIYDVKAKDNEERSALLAKEDLASLGLPDCLAEDVAALIVATRGHRPLAGRLAKDSRLFLDADLAILASSASEYGRYAADIALEYDWMEPEAYRKGRAHVLKKFLDRKQLFYTPSVRAELQKKAVANMEREFFRLRAS
ncbi:MAG: type III pantothenate kinase [Candidatus Melainabacteria bacterium]|nr:type III pantothenate kinase [Candidatus Melainabacteria bacterium]